MKIFINIAKVAWENSKPSGNFWVGIFPGGIFLEPLLISALSIELLPKLLCQQVFPYCFSNFVFFNFSENSVYWHFFMQKILIITWI